MNFTELPWFVWLWIVLFVGIRLWTILAKHKPQSKEIEDMWNSNF